MTYSKLFRSRWAALLWAGGILWTAYDIAGASPAKPDATTANASAPADTDATGAPVDDKDLAILANVMKGN